MEIGIRDFVNLRLREIDKHLVGFFGSRNKWRVQFSKDCGLNKGATAHGFLELMDARRGRVSRDHDAINLRVSRLLERWAAEKTGFESAWVLTRPSRFTTRRKSLPPTTVPRKPYVLVPADPIHRLSGSPTLPDEDEECTEEGPSSCVSDNPLLASGTINIMSNPQPAEPLSPQCSTPSLDTSAALPYPAGAGDVVTS